MMKTFSRLPFMIGVLLLCLTVSISASAETRQMRDSLRHEVRVGWGDQLFETLIWHAPQITTIIPDNPYLAPEDYHFPSKENYRYTQHLFVEYQYRFNRWFGLGAMVDGSGVLWDDVTRDGKGRVCATNRNQHFYNLIVMPTVRFTYFWHPNVNLYSGLGLGMDINGGTELDVFGHHTSIGAAVNITALGLSANYQRYFAAVEFGGAYALRDGQTMFLLGSRLFTASVGVRF